MLQVGERLPNSRYAFETDYPNTRRGAPYLLRPASPTALHFAVGRL
jgi:hypothetical protein